MGEAEARGPEEHERAWRPAVRQESLVEPDVLEAETVVDAVDLRHVALDVGLHADRRAVPHDDRPRSVLEQLAIDLPNQLAPLVDVGLGRLRLEQLLDLGIAVAGVVAFRLAGEILEE